jgi:hypothetical protein
MINKWTVKRVSTFPKEWKVIPENHPWWEDNKPENYFEDEFDAMLEAEKRNNLEKDDLCA